MKNSDAFLAKNTHTSHADRSNVAHLNGGIFNRAFAAARQSPWTDELERRRKAVARWRGEESAHDDR